MTETKIMSLDNIGKKVRGDLEALEDEIISHIISRAQFAANPEVYKRGYKGNNYQNRLDHMLKWQEEGFSREGRYLEPTERPFNRGLPLPEVKPKITDIPKIYLDDYDSVNVGRYIMEEYIKFVPRFCLSGTKNNQFGSSAEHDIYVLMVIAQRIHSGIRVAEWKYLTEPERFDRLIASRNRSKLEEVITDEKQEKRILKRVRRKAKALQAEANPEFRTIVNLEIFVDLFKEMMFSLTKEVQVLYLLNRVN